MTTTSTTEFFRKPYLTTATYALALLLFLLPFFDIRCNNVSMARLSGISMATGGNPRLSREMEDMRNSFPGERTRSSASVSGEGKLFIPALIALAMAVAGLIYSLLNKSIHQRAGLYIGILGALALIGSWIQVSAFVSDNAETQQSRDPDDRLATMIEVTAAPTFWFILCLLCFLAAAYISYKKEQPAVAAAQDEPPQTAPQIKLQNPGDQSNFPSAPEGERDLG